MARRTVDRIVPGITVKEGAGFLVHRGFPNPELDYLDPFLLLDEMGPTDHAPGRAHGAPDHPHRGFETVTYLLAGEMEHQDSHGHRGRLRPGGVQWMTAGSGVIHSEMPTPEFQRTGGRMHGFQIWVNLPRAEKMSAPRYQEIAHVEPVTIAPNVSAKIISGTIGQHTGPARTLRPVTIAHVELGHGASVEIPVEAGAVYGVWVFEGALQSGTREIDTYHLAMFSSDGDAIHLEAPHGSAACLLLGGVPLREPIARYGPFVMNYKAEILQAVEDFQEGRFGRIPAQIENL